MRLLTAERKAGTRRWGLISESQEKEPSAHLTKVRVSLSSIGSDSPGMVNSMEVVKDSMMSSIGFEFRIDRLS